MNEHQVIVEVHELTPEGEIRVIDHDVFAECLTPLSAQEVFNAILVFKAITLKAALVKLKGFCREKITQ